MSIVFINDHRFYIDKYQNVFTSGTLTSDVWSRFTENFGKLTVIGRGVLLPNTEHNHKLSSVKNVDFDLFCDIGGGLDYFRYKNKLIQKLTPYIRESEYIVLRLPSNIGIVAAELCRKYNKKYFVEVVGCAYDSMWYFGSLFSKILAPILANKNRKAIKNASAAIYVTSEYLQKRYPNLNMQINASNVVLEKLDFEVLERHKDHICQNNTPKRIGTIGNVDLPYKGYDILFRALKTLDVDYILEIVGGGKAIWINNLIHKHGLENKVTLRGRVNSKDEINTFLDSLDLYVHPSLTEGLPRSVIEAMSRACPIIASDAGGIPELIPPEFIYKKTDSRQLAKRIDDVLQDVDLQQSMSSENFRRAKDYTFDVINERRYKFLKKIKNVIKN